MSRGAFKHSYVQAEYVAREIDNLLKDGAILEGYPIKVLQRIWEARDTLYRASIMARRVDWFVSGKDDLVESFLDRWSEDLRESETVFEDDDRWKEKPPSYFVGTDPCCSIYGKSEIEDIAYRIVEILSKTGDTWRRLSWEEWASLEFGKRFPKYPEWYERKWFDVLSKRFVCESGAREFAGVWGRL
jgi:hypothetical protein